jgi:hypothetical protein
MKPGSREKERQMTDIEVRIVMNESGEYVVACDEETADELADSELNEDETRRYVTLKIRLSPPSDDDVVSVKTFEIPLD